jgi:hypothetical protein
MNLALVHSPVRHSPAIYERPWIEELPRPEYDVRSIDDVATAVEDMLADVYAYAFLETGRQREAERITNRAIERLADGLYGSTGVASAETATLRPRLMKFAEREVAAYRRAQAKREQLRDGRATIRRLVLAASVLIATAYGALIAF